jgi:cytochrome c oxidase subunit II
MSRSRAVLALLVVFSATLLLLPLTFGLPGANPPDAITESGDAINQVYWVVFALATVVFLVVEVTLIVAIFRFRRRPDTPSDAEGPQIHGNTRVEIIWTAIPAILLVALATYMFSRVPQVEAKPSGADAAEVETIRVTGHQFYWEYRYENDALSYDTIYLPVGRKVELVITSPDVPHSWWVPELTGKRDAIPGQTNRLYFTPRKAATLRSGVCGEFCGIQHARMTTTAVVMEAEQYDAWLEENAPQAEDVGLGKTQWLAACAKCHGENGQGDIGPTIAGNPRLIDFDSMDDLVRVNGQNQEGTESYMPPVGKGWTDEQLRTLIAYIESDERLRGPGGDGGGGGR